MEGAARFQKPESQEEISNPDLFALYADKEVTVFGITGTFRDLAEMCPIDLNDPSVTLEAKNEFVIKAANESGLEIEPEHKGLFEKVIEENNLEPKFTVAQAEESTLKDKLPKSVIKEHAPKESEPTDHVVREEKTLAPPPEIPQVTVRTEKDNIQEYLLPKPDEQNISIGNERHEPSLYLEDITQEATQETNPFLALGNLPKKPDIQNKVVDMISAISKDLKIFKAEKSEAEVMASQESSIVDDIENDMAEYSTENSQSNLQALGEELTKEPVEIFEDFARAFSNFIKIDRNSIPGVAYIETEKAEHQPEPIMLEVAERFQLLDEDEKEVVGVQLRNIVGAVHGLLLLEERGADIERIEDIKTQLEDLCVELLETLEINYVKADIQKFVEALLSPDLYDLLSEQEGEEPADLTKEGSHEAKNLRLYKSRDDGTHIQIRQILGMFALSALNLNLNQ